MTQEIVKEEESAYKEFISHIRAGEIEKVEKALRAKDKIVNQLQPLSSQPPLYFAAIYNTDETACEMIKLLLRYGANAKFKDKNEQTILFYIFRDGKEQCAQLLLTHGLSLDQIDQYGQTPIFYAMNENRLEMARKYSTKERINLIDKIADQTPLYYAARRGHLDMCKLLIEKGAQVAHLDAHKKTAVQYAMRAKFTETAEYLAAELQKIDEANKNLEEPIIERKKKAMPKEPKQTYKLVMYDASQLHSLSVAEAANLFAELPKLRQFLANPDLIPEEELASSERETWKKLALKIISSCIKVRGSFYFLNPVDPVKLGVSDYFDIISMPMDLGTVKQRIQHNYYAKPEEFLSDMRLIWQNCYHYNGENHEVSFCAKQMESCFGDLILAHNFQKYLTDHLPETEPQ